MTEEQTHQQHAHSPKLAQGDDKPLQSWKEIAAYLDRDVRTARRWEQAEGLPVRRHRSGGRSSVYAYPSELDAWRAARKPSNQSAEGRSIPWRSLVPVGAGGLVLLAVGAFILRGPILNPPDSLAEAAGPGVVIRQVWTGPQVDALGSPSADGRFLSYVHWETGDLAIRDLDTGEYRLLTGKGSWDVSSNYAQSSSMSPDGKLVVYAWANSDPEVGFYELRIVGTDGSEPQVLYRNEEVPYLEPKGWSSDGEQILATFFTKDRTTQIALISVDDRSVRVVKTLNWDRGLQASLSPDGRYIAYDFARDGPQTARDVFLLAADGSRETPLVRQSANDFSPIWTPDGGWVVFASNRTGTMGLWAVRVANGRGEGEPLLLKRDIGMRRPMGFTDGGDLFYGVDSGQQDVYIASLGLDEGAALTTPVRATEHFVGSNRSPEWSPDGRHLAYFSYRQANASTVLSIWSPETGKYREPPIKLSLSPSDVLSQPRWSPDGRALAIRASNRRGRQGIYRVDLQTGAETPLALSGPGEGFLFHAWSPDGKAIFFRKSFKSEPNQLVKRNLETGEEKVFYRAPVDISALALSPDGEELAFVAAEPGKQVLNVMLLDGGSIREIARPNGIFRNTLAWTPDGRHLLFGAWENNSKSKIWVVSADGGEPRKLDLDIYKIEGLTVRPDGKRIAFTSGVHDSEVWVMENFLPELRAAK